MIPLTYEENKSYKKQEAWNMFCMDKDDENYKNKRKVRITVMTQENLEELLITNAA